MIDDLINWAKEYFTRKFTVPFHIAGGMICAFLYHYYPGLAITLFVSFGILEWWQAEKEGDKGHSDFCDALIGAFIGASILLIINIAR